MSVQFWKIPANGGIPKGFNHWWLLATNSSGDKFISVGDLSGQIAILQFPLSSCADKWLARTGEDQYTIADDEQLKRLRLEDHFATFPDEAKRKKLVEGCMEVPYSDFSADDANIFFALVWKGYEPLNSLNYSAKEALCDKNWPEALRHIPAEFWGDAENAEQPKEKGVEELVKEGKDMEARIQAARQKSFANIGGQPEPPRPKLYLVVADGFGSKEAHVIATDPTEAERKSGLRNVKSITVVSESPIL